VTRTVFGGSCYLNNAAIAAQSLRDRDAARVAVIDIDAHHANGTQSIFYARGDVFVTSLHIDPAAGWFPHHAGFADEVGCDQGRAANLNIPLAEGTGDEGWLAALAQMVETVAAFNPDAVVVSLGVDAAADDPESPLNVSADGYHAAGALIAALDRPTVAVQEGGYHLPTLGGLVVATLAGMSSTAG
jgi:acetoin utilization deacetylase AcuC-like enzyme